MKGFKVKSVRSLGIHNTYNVTMAGAQHNYQIIDGFGNKIYTKNSHSVAYSFISLQTMYLKVYYPLEFMCNLLTSEIDNTDKNEKLDSYIKEATRMGITVKQPDLNKSSSKFVIEKGISQKSGQIGTEIEYIRL